MRANMKTILIILIIVGALIMATLSGCSNEEELQNEENTESVVTDGTYIELGSFDVEEYSEILELFPSDEIYGKIVDSEDAAKKAEDLWEDIYGSKILKNKPYNVYYDKDNDVWLVEGVVKESILPIIKNGGAPYVIFEGETGKVLAVWHDK